MCIDTTAPGELFLENCPVHKAILRIEFDLISPCDQTLHLHLTPYGQIGRMGPSASSYDGSEKLPVGVSDGSICADELEENACLRHGIR
jgi:hypothetical protein